MKILDAWIARHVIGGALLALAVLLSLTAVVGFVEELDAVGKGSYGIGRCDRVRSPDRSEARRRAVPAGLGDRRPQRARGLLPSRGSSPSSVPPACPVTRTVGSVLMGALTLMAIAVHGRRGRRSVLRTPSPRPRRAAALDEAQTRGDGFWIREGRRFVNAVRVRPDGAVEDMYIYEIGPDGTLRTVTHAAQARYRDGAWVLESVRWSEVSADGVGDPVHPPRGMGDTAEGRTSSALPRPAWRACPGAPWCDTSTTFARTDSRPPRTSSRCG